MFEVKKGFFDRPVVLIATGFGSGYAPFAPGTAGSIVGVVIFFLIKDFPIHFYIAFTLALTLAAIPIASRAEKIFGTKDSGKIVIDEIAGQLITLIAVPHQPVAVFMGFLLFRFFDIWKPFYALEKLKGGVGIMIDDVAAGICALAVLQGALFFTNEYAAL